MLHGCIGRLGEKIQVTQGTELKSWEDESLLLPLHMIIIPDLKETEGNVTETLELGPHIHVRGEVRYGLKGVVRMRYQFLLGSIIALHR